MTDLVTEEKAREAEVAAHEAGLAHLRAEVAAAQVLTCLCDKQQVQREDCVVHSWPHSKDRQLAATCPAHGNELSLCNGCAQNKLKEAEGATAAEAAKLAALQERLDGAAAERDSAHEALAASRQEAATAQEQLAEARKQVTLLDSL